MGSHYTGRCGELWLIHIVSGSYALSVVVDKSRWEASLWRRYKLNEDDSCRQSLFDEYRDYALMLSLREFRRRPAYGLEKSDFDQFAFMGLLQAIERYDPFSSCRFETFARYRIIGSISDGLVQSSERASAYSTTRRIERDRVTSLMRVKSVDDIFDPVDNLRDLVANLAIGILIETITEKHTDSLADHTTQNAYESLQFNQMSRTLLEEVDMLPSREKTVVKRHYLEDMTFKLIAKLLGLSKGRISQLHKSALQRLRSKIGKY